MKISTKGRYGLRIMLDVARNDAQGPVSIPDIAKRQSISAKYTEQITGALVKCGLLRSVRGPQGGYVLLKQPSEYTVWEILLKTEGDLSPVECVNSLSCNRAESCTTRKLWQGLDDCIHSYLSNITLQDLADNKINQYNFT